MSIVREIFQKFSLEETQQQLLNEASQNPAHSNEFGRDLAAHMTMALATYAEKRDDFKPGAVRYELDPDKVELEYEQFNQTTKLQWARQEIGEHVNRLAKKWA